MTCPAGHSHPLTKQMRGQAIGLVVLHVRWQLGCEAHSFLICPSMGQAAIEKINNCKHIFIPIYQFT